MLTIKESILAGAATVALVVGAAPALAQQATTSAPRGATDTTAQSPDEIVVTAQKREERLVDVPISMAVLQGADLDKSTASGALELLSRLPSVSTSTGYLGGQTILTIRGVNGGSAYFNGSSPIGYYLDGAPFGLVKSALVPDINVYDLDRVEVLRGPQGTLYGASAQNGVVRVITHDPDLDRFAMKARTAASHTRYGDWNFRGDAAINVPIIEGKLAARAVVSHQDDSGWIDKPDDKDANDGQITTVRLKIAAAPTERLTVGLAGWFSRSKFGMPNISADNRTASYTTKEPIETNFNIYTMKLRYDFGSVAVNSVSSYLDFESDNILYFGLPFTTNVDSRVFTQEVTVNSQSDGPWEWALGAVYRNGKDNLFQNFELFTAPTALSDRTKSFAVYGEVTRSLLDDALEVTAGLRYFRDTVTNVETSRLDGTPPSGLFTNTSKFEKLSPRAVVAYHPNSRATIYASYSEGFRSGFPQNGNTFAIAPEIPPLKADNLRNYEIGAKGDLFGGSLSVEAAVFYIDWQDVQQTLNIPTSSVPISALVNGESASGLGAEVQVIVRPTGRLQLSGAFGFNDLTQDSNILSGGQLLFLKGERLNQSPKYTVSASLDYSVPLGDELEGRLSLSGNYTSKMTTIREPTATLPSLSISDDILITRASFSIATPSNWTVAVYADNLNNEQGIIFNAPYLPDMKTRVRPRTIGIQLDYRF